MKKSECKNVTIRGVQFVGFDLDLILANNLVDRAEADTKGGQWLAIYVPRATRDLIYNAPPGTLACFYCGFNFGEGHDFACRYVNHNARTKGKGTNEMIFVPKGGVPPSNSFF